MRYDVPVVCTQSGIVTILEFVIDPAGRDALLAELHRVGPSHRFEGTECIGCLARRPFLLEKPVCCTYRTLVGPLYVPGG